MKTTVQQLMSELEELHPNLFDVHTEKGRQFVNNFIKYIKIEKDALIDAFKEGTKMVDVNDELDAIFNGIIYYEEKYKL